MTDKRHDPTDIEDGLRSFITFKIARVQNRLNAQASALLRKHTELSLTEWRILSLVNTMKTTTASAISREAEMDKGQISRAVKQLIDRGFLSANAHVIDQRQTMLSLTDRGQSEVTENIKIMHARQKRLTQHIDDHELAAFYRVLDKLYENADMP